MKPDVKKYYEAFRRNFKRKLHRFCKRKYILAMELEDDLIRRNISRLDFDDDELLPSWAERILRGKWNKSRLSKNTRIHLTLFHNTLLKRRRLMKSKGIDSDPTEGVTIAMWDEDNTRYFLDADNPNLDDEIEGCHDQKV